MTIYISFIFFYLRKVESYNLQFKSMIRFTKPLIQDRILILTTMHVTQLEFSDEGRHLLFKSHTSIIE